jgi:hypothetical protein
MSMSPAALQHQAKIQRAKRSFETDEGKTIDPAHVQEWALLEIAEMLQAIHYQVTMLNIPKPGSPFKTGA